jgi:DNA polymerase IV
MAFCCDCLTHSQVPRRCTACGGMRLIDHPEAGALAVAHVDCDAFYAAVEKRDNPALRDMPLIIGGGRRGVVSTACYVARTFGVRSAMPMFKALAACPDAVVIKPDMEKYRRVGHEVRRRMLELTPLVEPLSIDEAFLDLSGTEALHGRPPCEVLAEFARSIERDIGITVSVGLSHNKFLAKLASDLDKPRGYSIIGRAETLDFLAPLPAGRIWGVGKAMQEKLQADGVRTIGDLRLREEADLFRRYGTEGGRLYRLSRGIDHRKVTPERETKSVSAETTFNEDIRDIDQLSPILWTLCEKVARRLRAAGLAATGVTLKLKTADFRILSRSRAAPEPTQLATRLYSAARDMLAVEASGKLAFRLIGVGSSGLAAGDGADRGDLLDADVKREIAAADAMARIREKFGDAAVIRGTGIGARD